MSQARTKRKLDSSSGGPSSLQRWKNVRHQTSLGSDFLRIEATGSWPDPVKYLEFELPAGKMIKFGSKTFFEVWGKFERLVTNEAVPGSAQTFTGWRQCTNADAGDFIISPNWFDFLVQKCELISANQSIQVHNLPGHIMPLLNTFLYYYMDKEVKESYAPQPYHPIHCLPGNNVWTFESKDWKDYAKLLFSEDDDVIKFQHYPLNVFPFCQNLNHEEQKSIPLSNFEKMSMRYTFVDNFNIIIKTRLATDASKFRFKLNKMILNLEEDRVSSSLKIPTKNLSFKGHAFLARYDTIPQSEKQYKIRFLKSALPEQMVILAVNKSIMAGQYNFSTMTLTDATKFTIPSNLTEVHLLYEGHELASKVPNFEQFDNGPISTQILKDTLHTSGLMTMRVDKKRITYHNCADEFANTPFPFIVIDYTLGDGSLSRIYPSSAATKNQSLYAKDGNIELNLTFSETGAPADAVFLFFSSILVKYSVTI